MKRKPPINKISEPIIVIFLFLYNYNFKSLYQFLNTSINVLLKFEGMHVM